VMMCGLLAAAVGLTLGSRVTPSGLGTADAPTLPSWLLGRIEADQRAAWPLAADGASMPAPAAAVSVDKPEYVAEGLEGHRRPRGPRVARDDAGRVAR
jgi:hypothetical protein